MYTRRQLLGLRCVPGSKSKVYVNEVAIHGLLRYRGNRAGLVTHRRQDRASVYKHDPDRRPGSLQIVHSRRQSCSRDQRHHRLCADRSPCRRSVVVDDEPAPPPPPVCFSVAPSMYVLNAAALTKPHAVQQLNADFISYDVDVAVITETHLKVKHSDSVVNIPGYTLWRRDRAKRRGGGVALYVRSTLPSSAWTFSADDRSYELLWMRVGDVLISALYHPPRPQYSADSLLDYVESCVAELTHDHPTSTVVLAGDFNQLPHSAVVERTGLTQLVQQPTRAQNVLDQVYV